MHLKIQGMLPSVSARYVFAWVGLACLSIPFYLTCAYGAQLTVNCSTDFAPDEVTICGSNALSQLDRQMADLYGQVRDALGTGQQIQLRNEQRIWLRQRAACQTSASCIANAYRARIPQLRALLGSGSVDPDPGERPPGRLPSAGSDDACVRFPNLC